MNRRDIFDPKSAFLNPDLEARFSAYSRFFSLLVLTIGTMPLAGWLIGSVSLKQILPFLPPMRPFTAIELILIGASLLCATYPKRRVVYLSKDILAFLTIFFSLLALYEYATNTATLLMVFTTAFFSEKMSAGMLIIPPTISLLFIIAGLALLFIDTLKRKNVYQYLLLFGFLFILPSIIEHFYGIDFIYGFASHTKIALHVTVAFVLLYVGILFSRPNRGFMAVYASDSAGGYLARRLLITGLVLPLLIGGTVFLGNTLGLYDQEFRFLLFTSLIIFIFSIIVWRNARAIHELDIARRESEQSVYRLAAIVESSDDAIIGRDMKGIITDWNRGAEELFGYKAQEIIGKPVSLLFPREKRNDHKRFNNFIKLGKSIKEYEADRITKDGTIIPTSITASPIRNSSGRVIGLSSISRDITERKQIERQRELFIGIASHELKTPVTSTKAYAQILKKHFEKKRDTESIFYLTKMDAQLNKLTELIGYLLDVSTIQKGQLQLVTSQINFGELIEETIEELQRTTSHEIELQETITKQISGDKSRLTQVIRNLLTNAIKYSPQAKKVIVACSTDAKTVSVSITDFGIGIPKDEQKKVFEPLYRSRGAKKDHYSGLGLGLYLTREIIKKHGGQITLKSKVGVGTTVSFTLPRKGKKNRVAKK